MPDARLLETFPTPAGTPFVIEHVSEEFTSLCPKTGHPDFGRIILRYCPSAPPPERKGPAHEGTVGGVGGCVELRSLKLYYQSFRNEGIFYEDVTNRIRDDLAARLQPRWLQVITEWKGRGGLHSRIIAESGEVPAEWKRG